MEESDEDCKVEIQTHCESAVKGRRTETQQGEEREGEEGGDTTRRGEGDRKSVV